MQARESPEGVKTYESKQAISEGLGRECGAKGKTPAGRVTDRRKQTSRKVHSLFISKPVKAHVAAESRSSWSGKRDGEGTIKLIREMPAYTGPVGVYSPGEVNPRCFSICGAAD